MSTPGFDTSPPAAPPPAAQPPPARRSHIEEIVLVLLLILSGVGVVMADRWPESAFRYWLWMTPIFGIVSIFAAWGRAQRRGLPVATIVPTQIVHWLGAVGCVWLIYALLVFGRMNNEAAGSATLIVLALSAFLAGVYSDWRLSVLGLVLGVASVGFAYVESVALIVVPLLAVALIGLVLYIRRA
ncbi:MAG: hypothetical protein ABI629_11160 [bacterium]